MEDYQIQGQDLPQKTASKPIRIILNIVLSAVFILSLAPRALGSRARAHYEKGEYETALIYLNIIGWIHPNNAAVYYFLRGLTQSKLDKYELALADYSKAIDLDPNFASAYVGRCNIYNNQMNFVAASVDCTKAIELGTSEIMVYSNRGWAYFYQEKYDLAISDLTKAIESNPEDAFSYLFRGMSYSGLGNYEQAIADLTRAIEINPDKNAYCVLGVTYTKMGDFSSAVTSFEEGLGLSSNDDLGWCKTALEHAKQGIPTP